MDMEYCAAAEQQLTRLRQHVFLLAPCSSPAAMAGVLEGVARVYEHAAESMARCARPDQVDGELEASVALLDTCAATRSTLGAMRACALDAEIAARRRDGAAAGRAARACARLAKRVCADARRQRRRAGGSRSEHKAADGGGNALQEARRLTELVLERVATALSRRVAGGGGDPRPANSWSTCVARAFRRSARVACEDAGEATLPSVPSKDMTHDGAEATLRVQREMRALGDTIQQLEDGLELLFRRLVQCRVFLLNMRSC
ncbi:unnamed protein product [Urochloa decumbens]|uniref:Uncharacterized protein n=1 Tax=Urochloa decumbens TaxID=240449 RepID=A0ABC9C2X1_9POAL